MAAVIPVDVWSHITSWSTPQDLAQLMLVSQSFLDIFRPILYRSLILRNNKDTVWDTFNLLNRDNSLAKRVTKLHLITVTRLKGSTWVDFGAIARMTHLRSLQITAPPFYTDKEQQKFVRLVSRSCRLLREFTYRDSTLRARFPSRWFPIAGIERFRWYSSMYSSIISVSLTIIVATESSDFSDAVSPCTALSCISASLLSITHLILLTDINYGREVALPLFECRFPRLTFLHLGDWVRDDSNSAMTEFIIAHPLIDYLSLAFNQVYSDLEDASVEFSESIVRHDMLPCLRTFRGAAKNVLILARQGVRSLHMLSGLFVCATTFSQVIDPDESIDRMFWELGIFGGLPSLKEFHFVAGRCVEDKLKKWTAVLAKICPVLERLSLSGNIDSVQAVSNTICYCIYRAESISLTSPRYNLPLCSHRSLVLSKLIFRLHRREP